MSGYANLQAGINHVGNYTISGIPYVTSSLNVSGSSGAALEITFPSITQMIKVHNHDKNNDLRVGFSANGVKGTNYWTLDSEKNSGSSYMEFRVRANKIYLLGDVSAVTGAVVFAELTGINVGFDLATVYSGSDGIG